MKVSYKIGYGDLAAFMWIHRTRTWSLLLLNAGVGLFAVWNVFRSVRNTAHSLPVIIITAAVFFVLVFASVFLLGYALSLLFMFARANKTFLTEHTLELTDDAILSESAYDRSEYRWNIVQRVVRTSRYLILYTQAHGGIIIPRRAFATREEWEALYSYVRDHVTG